MRGGHTVNEDLAPRVLAILLGLVGDTLMRLPALRALRVRYPAAHLVAVCEPLLAPAMRDDPLFDRVITYRRHGAGPVEQVRFFRELRRERCEIALDFYYGGRTPLLAWLSGARRRIGPARSRWARLWLTDPLPHPLPAAHMVDRHLEIVRPLGVTALERRWVFPVSAASERAMQAKLAAAGFTEGPRAADIVVVAGAGDISKRWDDAQLGELVRRVAAGELGAQRRVFIVADRREPELTAGFAGCAGARVLPPLELPELGALFREVALVVCPDTGPLHVALGTAPRVVTYYQATDPDLHRAERPGYRYLYHKVCPYQPCDTRDKDKCRLECRRSITPDEMLDAAAELLAPDVPTGP